MRTRLYSALGALLLLSPTAAGQVIAQHSGSADPLTEGFALEVAGASGSGPMAGDMGFDAWRVSASGMARYATGDLPPRVKADALAKGFKISLFARVAFAPDGRGLVTANLENLGGRRFDINLGVDSNGDTFVRLNTNIITTPQLVGVGPTYTLAGAGQGYHLFELVFDAATQTADLFVDGVERISDYAGHTNFVRPLGFYMGCYQNHAGHYALARFEVTAPAPVPALPTAGLALMLAALLALGTRTLKRHLAAAADSAAQPTLTQTETPS